MQLVAPLHLLSVCQTLQHYQHYHYSHRSCKPKAQGRNDQNIKCIDKGQCRIGLILKIPDKSGNKRNEEHRNKIAQFYQQFCAGALEPMACLTNSMT